MDVVKLVAGRAVEPDSSEEDNEVDNRSERFSCHFLEMRKQKHYLKVSRGDISDHVCRQSRPFL